MEKSELLENYFVAYMNTVISNSLNIDNFNMMNFVELYRGITAKEINEIRDLCHSIRMTKVMDSMVKLADSHT
jgi:hypothetical protein